MIGRSNVKQYQARCKLVNKKLCNRALVNDGLNSFALLVIVLMITTKLRNNVQGHFCFIYYAMDRGP